MAVKDFKHVPVSLVLTFMVAACGGGGSSSAAPADSGVSPNSNPGGSGTTIAAADMQECLSLGDKPFSLIFDQTGKITVAGNTKLNFEPTGFFANTAEKSYKRTDFINTGGWIKVTENNFYVGDIGTRKTSMKIYMNSGTQLQSEVIFQDANLELPSALQVGSEKSFGNVSTAKMYYPIALPESKPITANRRVKLLSVEPLNTKVKNFPKTCKIEVVDIAADSRGGDIRSIMWVAPKYNVVRSETTTATLGTTIIEVAQIPLEP
jgi:hypothetical protein